MSCTAERRLSLFLKQKGVYHGGVAHVPLKAFLPFASALIQDVHNISAVSASKMVKKALSAQERGSGDR